MSAPLVALECPRVVRSSAVFKSGHLLISSKGLGWKSWKKRWFILTRNSLVFFKSDPSALPLRGGEVNLTLGGIDLNNAGSVVVREDKKLLTVLFPDHRDGRAFTLKAETTKDLYEWKTALEHALTQAPSTDLVMGHNGIFRTDSNDTTDGSLCQWRDKSSVTSLVVACPILLALEDIDGGPSFLEKALRFLEKYGLKVEGILRQSADVEEVERRVQEYERGKTEFNPDEDAHVIGDCVKHVLRVLPSSPVPASCCIALLEAYRIDLKEARVNALHSAIQEIFPKPNRRLLQRVLKMMRAISSHASDNQMTSSAVAACMAPLLLRPLVAGECELEDSYDTNGDNSAQLLAAANAANNAQAIITLLLEEYENIFYDNGPADSRTSTSGSEDKKPDEKVNGHHDPESDIDLYDYKEADGSPSNRHTLATVNANLESGPFSDISSAKEPLDPQRRASDSMADACVEVVDDESQRSMGYLLSSIDQHPPHQSVPGPELLPDTSMPKLRNSNPSSKKLTFWRRSARRTYSTESIDFFGEEELAIQRLEIAKNDLGQRIAKERRGNAILQASLERRKQALHERRLALEQDVARLQEQLQAERDLRAALEVSISLSSGQFSGSRCMDSKSRVELEEIALAEADVARLKQQVTELNYQLNQQRQHNYRSLPEASNHYRNSQQKYSCQDFDSTLAVSNHERKQRTEVSGSNPRNSKGQLPGSGRHSRQPSRNQLMESTNLFDSYEASKSVGIESPGKAAYVSSASRTAAAMEYPRHPSTASSTLLELATRLGFFKEKRSQLMQQLHNLDFNYGPTAPEAFVYNLSSPRRH